jgi:uncharacterized protein YcnI
MTRPVSLLGVIVLAAVAAGASAQSADAHVLIRPDQAPTETLTLFTVLSPDEKAIPLTGLRVTIPPGLVVSSVADTPGYRTQIVRDQSFRTAAIAWTGGDTAPTHLALFHFAALTPSKPTTVHLSGLQTFADGSTKLWPNVRIDVTSTASAASSEGASRTEVILALVAAIAALIAAAGAVLIATRGRAVRSGGRDRSNPRRSRGAGGGADRH